MPRGKSKNLPASQASPASPAGWFETLLVMLVFFIAAGDPVPGVNEPHYLCRLKHFWNPDWAAGDLFLESTDAHLTIVLLLGWLTKWVSLPVLAWVGRVAAWGLLAYGWQRLCRSVTNLPFVAPLSAAVWVVAIAQTNFAGEWVIGGVEAKPFAYGFVLLALRAYLQDRWNAVWVHLGIASALHVLVGGWSVIVLLAIWAIYHRRQVSLRSLFPGLLTGGVISLAGVLPPLLMNAEVLPDVAAEANRIYVFERLPHHLAPLAKPASWIAERGGRHAIILALLAVATWLVRRQSEEDQTSESLRRLNRFAWGALVLAAIGLVIEIALWNQPLLAAKLLKFYWFRLTDVAAPLAVSIALVTFAIIGLRHRQAIAAWPLVAMLGLCGWHFGTTTLGRLEKPIPRSDAKMRDYDAWLDACDWIAKNTQPDAMFLVPRQSQSFKWRTGRAEVVTYKDIPQDAGSMVEWFQRFDEVYRYPTPAGDGIRYRARSLGHLGANHLRKLGEIYDADYALTTNQRPVSLPVVYRNRTYVIYRLQSGSESPPTINPDFSK